MQIYIKIYAYLKYLFQNSTFNFNQDANPNVIKPSCLVPTQNSNLYFNFHLLFLFWNIYQGWEFAHSLIAPTLIAHLLISLKSNERFAQIAQDKWTTVSEWLWSLRGNERCERFAQVTQRKWVHEQFALKILAKKI